MTFNELRKRYARADLSFTPGDAKLRYEIFSPFLRQLYENKLVYYEKFICLVKVEKLKMTAKGFEAQAVPLMPIERPMFAAPNRSWSFGGCWEQTALVKNGLGMSFAGWMIWPEPDRVKAVEEALKKNDHEHALSLTFLEPEPQN